VSFLSDNKSKKFVKRKFLLLDILGKINKGIPPYEIAKLYGWSRQRLNYYLKMLKEANLIRLKYRTNVAFYELTEECKNFYIGYVKPLSSGIRLHNVSFIYPILKEGNLTPQKVWQLNGVCNRLKRESNCSIVWNHKNLIINISSLVGNNAFDLFNKAKNIADSIAEKIQKDYGFELGSGKLNRKPHFAVLHPLINQISKHIEFSSEEAKIDESEGYGELEFFDPEKTQKFIELPERIEALENLMSKQIEILTEYSKQIALHLEVLNEMKETLKKINQKMV